MPASESVIEKEIQQCGLLDSAYYLSSYPDVHASGLDPVYHYCNFGWREGRKPNPYFDGAWYTQQNPDVLAADMNPLLHYVRHGDHEGRRPVPVFDTAWYRVAYQIAPDGLALAHFLTHRHGARALPSPELFFVLHTNPYAELAASGSDPFVAFAASTSTTSAISVEANIIRRSGLFDSNYYLLNGSDLLEVDTDPAFHFCCWGWREHRKPNAYFDTAWYLRTNPEVSKLSINPLAHYIYEGEAVGRRPIIYFDPTWYRETYAVPRCQSALEHYLERRHLQTVSPNPFFDPAWYVAQHANEVGAGRDAFAHYLYTGAFREINPSERFDAVAYRRRHLGRPSRLFARLIDPHKDNPLVHYLRGSYR